MKAVIVTHADMDTFDIVEHGNISVGYYSQRCPDKTTPNEDSLGFTLLDDKAILGVADGVGGAPKGEEASKYVINHVVTGVAELVYQTADPNDLRNRILNQIEEANNDLQTLGQGARTTLTACEITKEHLRSYQVGDSALLVCGQRGKLKHKTIEHSPVGYAVESGYIAEDDAIKHPDRHYVSNLMGEKEMRIEIGPHIELATRDTVLLASDGLFDNFYIEELIEIIRKTSLADVMTLLTEKCQAMRDEKKQNQFHKLDDVSFIVCRC